VSRARSKKEKALVTKEDGRGGGAKPQMTPQGSPSFPSGDLKGEENAGWKMSAGGTKSGDCAENSSDMETQHGEKESQKKGG